MLERSLRCLGARDGQDSERVNSVPEKAAKKSRWRDGRKWDGGASRTTRGTNDELVGVIVRIRNDTDGEGAERGGGCEILEGDGMDGMGRRRGNEMKLNGMEWERMEWDGMEWGGMEWDGMEWDGMGWNEMGWDGMGWK
ncbi:LOW QUALITY PROTEIN: hypothetical protein BC937DRAFT_92344 [Endogone sp. FLAS-F59071]|nr:LOW QUALITY PROTEIN: hypothetical protein BC937DRAFT_92344 [Endogone sp. FLAS-F59071]|eukprot:RUS21538.1 LOW QUALITY PROTEIN: hypothetical protein BC937DRAFT_92344 [Endogone sp. FLAS-F59071]